MRTGAWKFTSITRVDVGAGEPRYRDASGHARVVDQAVDPAERVGGFACDGFGAIEIGEIGGERARRGCVHAALLEHGVEPIGASGDEPDGGAACREHGGERGADAR